MTNIKELKSLAAEIRVLFVEDEPELRASVLTYLQKIFAYVESASNGEEGLAAYQAGEFDLVLSDILMPKMNGLEMTQKIRDICPEQEVIIISAYSDPQYFIRAIEIGISAYIIKPVNYAQMNQTLYSSIQKITRFKENRLYRTHLEELVNKRTQALLAAEAEKSENFEQTLFALVSLIENRDIYTGGHSQRVATYSKLIAQAMQFSETECETIYRAGILHDVGKVATPDSVLLKPGKLNTLEYQLIQEHVNVGYRLLSQIPMYRELAEIMRYHHEHYDGSGYPYGLSGEQIPPLSRIMIVADAFDAMTTNRIYKSRKTIPDAIKELQTYAGTQFDPEVVRYAAYKFAQLDEIEQVSQTPSSQLEQQRFSYFFRDQLTGCYNHEYLNYMLQRNTETPVYNYITVLYLKNFHQVNQHYGWEKGDEVLIHIAQHLQTLDRDHLTFRIRGDDFAILSQQCLDDIEQQLSDLLNHLDDISIKLSTQIIELSQHPIKHFNALEQLLIEE